MSISEKINSLTSSRNTIRSKMVEAGQATGTEKLSQLASDLNIGITDINTATPTFTEASTRANIASGETISTLFGKIKKFFTDLKTVAFTGSYSDLSNKPTIDTALSTASTNAVQNKVVKAEAVAIRKLSGIEIASSQLAVGATSVTFSNAAIKSTSQLTLYSDNSSNTPIFWTGVTVNNGVSAVYTFPALTVATTFYLQIINDFQTAVPA